MTSVDWRKPENRREAFLRFYGFHLKYLSHPGPAYSFLPAIAEKAGLDEEGRVWLNWINANTQNNITSALILEAAPTPDRWRDAIAFWREHYDLLEWDTDRRYFKSRFAETTEQWVAGRYRYADWETAGMLGWDDLWRFARSHPSMGRLSAWSMSECAGILLGSDVVPDAETLLLEDKEGSRPQRNGLAIVAGYEAAYWGPREAHNLGIVQELADFAEGLLAEARARYDNHPHATRWSLETAFCTYKGWHKPNRRYPNVYSDITFNRLVRAEQRFGGSEMLDHLWAERKRTLPPALRLESSPNDPGLVPQKQNHYLETGEIPMMCLDYPDMLSRFDLSVRAGSYGRRGFQR